MRRRLAGEPVARIVGVKEFWGLPLQLSAATLVPRPDTETVVELALEMLRARCRSRTPVAHRRHRHRLRRDLAGAVVRIAGRLRRRHRHQRGGVADGSAAMPSGWDLADRAAFVACDYAAALSGTFDLIVSNPPYIRSADIAGLATEVRDHDPLGALDGGADGLDAYRALIPQAARLLGARRRAGRGGGTGPKRRYRGVDGGGRVNPRPGPPRPIWRASGGPLRAEKCPHKARLGGKKTTWNIPRERLRSGHNIGPGLLAP